MKFFSPFSFWISFLEGFPGQSPFPSSKRGRPVPWLAWCFSASGSNLVLALCGAFFSPPLLGMWAQRMTGLPCSQMEVPQVLGSPWSRSEEGSSQPSTCPDLPWLAVTWCHPDVRRKGFNPLGWRGWDFREAALLSACSGLGTAAAAVCTLSQRSLVQSSPT